MKRVVSWFDLDLRSLALFRIIIGSTLLVDLICDFGDAKGLYTRLGVIPRSLWARMYEYNSLFSLHILNDSLLFIRILILLQLTLAILLVVGYRTRSATFGSWLLYVSLLNRNVLATDGGDQIGSYLLFAGIFLPLGARFSLDSLTGRGPEFRGNRVAGLGSIFLILQMMMLYLCAGIAKLQEPIWWSGEAMDTVLRWTEYSKPFADLLRRSRPATRAVTFLTPWLEISLPWFFIWGGRRRRLRLAAIIAFIGLHLFIAISMRLSFFSFYTWSGLIALLPSEVWDYRSPVAAAFLTPESRAECWLRGGAIFLALCSAYSALPALDHRGKTPYPDWVAAINDLDFGYQNWNLFREPQRVSGWYRAKATLHDGRVVDLLDGGEPYQEAKPRVTSDQFPSRRWLSFMMHVQGVWSEPLLRANFARWLAERWNGAHSPVEYVQRLVVIYYQEEHPPFLPDQPAAAYDYAIYQEGTESEQP